MNITDMRKLNSMTKYPSIPTYHEMGDKGRLKDTITPGLEDIKDAVLEGYEKVDGTNGRIILVIEAGKVTDFFIGTREEIIYAKGDRIINPELGLVDTLLPLANTFEKVFPEVDYTGLVVPFLEVYGGNLPAAKQYTDTKTFSNRIFDCALIAEEEFNRIMGMPVEKIASWRDHGGQTYMNSRALLGFAQVNGIPRVPFLLDMYGKDFPTTVQGVYDFMKPHSVTRVPIDEHHEGRSEGLVVRTADRRLIFKIRFEDYEKTLGIRR